MEYTKGSKTYKFPSVILSEILEITLSKLKGLLDKGKIDVHIYECCYNMYVSMYEEAIKYQQVNEMISLLSLVLNLEEFEEYLSHYEQK